MDEAKPFLIPKREVWEAFKRVKANQGAAGVDGQSIEDFEANLSGNLYKLWNRMSSGSYFPPPVRVTSGPNKQTFSASVDMSQWCQDATLARTMPQRRADEQLRKIGEVSAAMYWSAADPTEYRSS